MSTVPRELLPCLSLLALLTACGTGLTPADTGPAVVLPWDCEPECWGAPLLGSGPHRVLDLSLETGGPLAAGTWRGATDFVDGSGVTNSKPGLSSFDDSFVWGLTSTGDSRNLATVSGPGVVQVTAASPHRDGRVVAGWRTDAITLFGVQSDGTEAFVARQHSDGSLDWHAKIQSNPTSPTLITGLATAEDGAIFVTGTVYSGSDFYGAGADNVSQGHATSNAYEGQAFFAKLSPGGQWTWVQQIVAGATGWSRAHVITVDDEGAVVAGGIYGGPLDWKAGRTSDATDGIFVTRILSNGSVDWVAPAPGNDVDQAPTITGLDVGPDGKPWAVGVLRSESNSASVTFDSLTLENVGSEDAWIARAARGGNWEWVGSVGLATIEVALDDGWREFWSTRTALHDVAITPDHRIVALGHFDTREGLDNVYDASEQVDLDVLGAPLEAGGTFLVELSADARPEPIRAYPVARGVSLASPGVLAVDNELAYIGATFTGGFRLGIEQWPDEVRTAVVALPLRE